MSDTLGDDVSSPSHLLQGMDWYGHFMVSCWLTSKWDYMSDITAWMANMLAVAFEDHIFSTWKAMTSAIRSHAATPLTWYMFQGNELGVDVFSETDTTNAIGDEVQSPSPSATLLPGIILGLKFGHSLRWLRLSLSQCCLTCCIVQGPTATESLRRRAECSFGEHGLKHRAQWVV